MVAVAVALRPADFQFGAEAPDGSAWELFGERFETNPKLALEESDFEMLRVWNLYSQGHLPNVGGVMDQPTAMVEALTYMDEIAAKIRESQRRR